MEAFLIYIGKAALAAAAFYLVYLALFQHQKHFLFNRIYLPVSLSLSFLIPLITFTSIRYIEAAPVSYDGFAYLAGNTVPIEKSALQWQWFRPLISIYLIGSTGFLLYLVLGHVRAISIVRKSRLQKLFSVKVNVTFRDVHPFSFFNKIVLSDKTLKNPDLAMIVQHEDIHVRGKHTLDILFSEILFLFQWFNPFAWLLKDAIKNNLEFLTDDELTRTNDAQQYQLAMVGLAHKQGVAPFLTAMNGSQLKNRIIMMKKKTENKYALLKQLVVLPLLAVLVMGLSNREVKTEIVPAEKQLSIVVDGEFISTDNPAFAHFDFSKEFKGEDIINALELEEEVVSNFLVIDESTESLKYFIKTTNYIPGSNEEFDKLTSEEDVPEVESFEASKILYAVDNKIIETNEAKILNKDYESATILSGDNAVEKYGEAARDASVVDFISGSPNVSVQTKTDVKEISVAGKITDSLGKPLAGAAVLIKGKTIGTITDSNGDYLIKLENENETLVYVMTGFEKQEIRVQGKNVINVQLKSDGRPVEGSIQIRPTDVQEEPYVDKSGRGVAIRLNSSSQKEPFYIVDGKPVQDIKEIDPENIEKINVLKGVQAGAIYGLKGEENGVIEITTKRKSNEVKEQPLYMLDGKEVQNVDFIDPENIESISVLKDKSATELYGDKGKNGVILITTKAMADFKKADPLLILNGEKTNKKIDDFDPDEIESVSVFKGEEAIKKYGEDGKNGVIEIRMKNNEITSDLELRKFLAQNMKYPLSAIDNNVDGTIKLFVRFNQDGSVASILKEMKPDADIVKMDEVVVVAYAKAGEPDVSDKSNSYDALEREVRRVIEKFPLMDIPAFKGKAVEVNIKFILQKKEK